MSVTHSSSDKSNSQNTLHVAIMQAISRTLTLDNVLRALANVDPYGIIKLVVNQAN
jgi:hypothetical protein